ncbi:MAG: response regulator transcription factor [Bacteroidota bacterium]|nr:response regulator transcription factor [Bacteroidota bacterium]
MLPLPQVHLAILDDHRLFRQGISFILQRLPYQVSVVEAATFAELLPQLLARMPDLLLLDLQLPDVDGIEVAKRLLAEYPELKIVVLSMHTDDQLIAQMLKLGVRSYLPKDIDKDLLTKAITDVIDHGHHFTDAISKAIIRSVQAPPGPCRPLLPGLPLALTPRESEVLALLCEGKSTNEIAQQLFISNRTVEGHRQNLLEKTGTPNAVGLALYAVKHGLLAVPQGLFAAQSGPSGQAPGAAG